MGEERKTVGAFLLERLREWGVRRVFGYPGDGINGILRAFQDDDRGLEFVQVAHEFPSAAGVTETGTAPDFATVGLENVSFTRGEKTTGTVNVGADLTYNLPFDLGQAGRLGATLGFRYAGGTVGLQGTTGEVDVKYGGAQFFGGLRVSF